MRCQDRPARRTLVLRAARGVPDGGTHVASRPERARVVLGVTVTTQIVAFLVAATAFTAVVGMAVLSWLERSA